MKLIDWTILYAEDHLLAAILLAIFSLLLVLAWAALKLFEAIGQIFVESLRTHEIQMVQIEAKRPTLDGRIKTKVVDGRVVQKVNGIQI